MFLRILIIFIFAFSFVCWAVPDETPRVISGQSIIDVDENTDFVANFVYQDGDGDNMTLSLEGEDEALFSISNQGQLSFITPPDYEQPDDANKNNTYVLRVNARDKTGSPFAIDLSVNVAPVNEAPILTNTLNHEIVEDHVFELNLVISEEERDDFNISLGGQDASLFAVDESQVLSMTVLPNFEIPADENSDNVYQISVTLTDEFDANQSFDLTLSVLNREEQGFFSGVSKISIPELSAKNGEQAPLFPNVTWVEPDNVLTGHTLFFTNLLQEDSISLISDLDNDLVVEEVTGAVSYQNTVIANIDLNAMGQDGENFRVSFTQAATETSANLVLHNLVYQNSKTIPTPDRQIKAVLVDSSGLLSAMYSEFAFHKDESLNVMLQENAGRPTLADLDQDGDLDLIMGTTAGKLSTRLNTSGNYTLSFESNTQSAGYLTDFDVGTNAAPTFVDIDGDGDLDVFVGNGSGFVSYFENTTSGSEVSFVARLAGDNPLSLVDVGENANVAFVDIDDDGDKDVFIGNQAGQVKFYQNQGTATQAEFESMETSPIQAELIGSNLSLTFADIDSDGDQDGIIASDDGKLHLYKNVGVARTPSFISGASVVNPFDGYTFQGQSSPIVLDIDADLDMDVWVYDESKVLNAIINDSGLMLEVVWRENQAPAIEQASQVDVIENLPILIKPVVTDAEQDEISFKWQQVSGDAVTVVIDNQNELAFTSPEVEAETQLLFRFTASDGREESVQDVLVRVFPIGTRIEGFHLPQITLPDSVSVNENEAVNLSAIVTDEDAQTITLSWELISGPAIELVGADTLTPSFIAPEVNEDTSLVIQLVVNDGVFDVQKVISITVMDTGSASTPVADPEDAKEDDSADLFGLSISWWHVFLSCLLSIYRRRSK